MFQERIDALEQRYKEREEKQNREFEELETIQNEEYRRDVKQTIHDSQIMFIQTLKNAHNDGALSSRSLRPNKAPMEEPGYHREAIRRSVHHQVNWYDSNYDNGDDVILRRLAMNKIMKIA